MKIENSTYRQTEIGVIPDDWVIYKLNSLGKFSKGSGVRKDEALDGDIPCIRYGELYTKHDDYIKQFYSFITKEVSLKAKKLKTGDILFAGSGETKEEIGKCVAFISEIEAFAGGDIVILSPVNVDSLYLAYLLNIPMVQKQKANRGQGDAVVHISASQLGNIQIPLPPTLAEQTAIAGALSDADNYIASLSTLIAKKRLIKQGAMQELLRPKEGWVVKKLGEIAEFRNGKAHENYIDENGDFIVVNSKFISTDGEVYKCSNVAFESLSIGEIAMVMSDIPNGKALAKCFIVKKDNKYTLNQRICSLRAKFCVSDFLYWILNRNNYFLAFDSGTGQTNLKKQEVLDCPVAFPSKLEEQTRIATILSDMDNEIEALEKKLEKARQIKQGMMQQLLTGKIRLV